MHSTSPSQMQWWRQRRSLHGIMDNPRLDKFESATFPSAFSRADAMEKAVIHVVISDPVYPSNDLSRTVDYIASISAPLTHLDKSKLLPPKQRSWGVRHLRLSVLTVYRRIFTLIFIANLIGLLLLLRHPVKVEYLGFYASVNFLVAILFRQDFIVNLIFRTAWSISWSFPLRIRRMAARAYTYGGIHSGASVAGTMWFLAFTWMMTLSFVNEGHYTLPVLVVTWVALFLLVMVCLLAFPDLRSRYHNTFEITHRFLGWITIALFWVQVILQSHHTAVRNHFQQGTIILYNPTFWNLFGITLLLLIPWIRLRRWDFIPHLLSPHALRLEFKHQVHRFSCLSISISPFGEYHPFATFPSADVDEGRTSLIISAAGDWTKQQVIQAQQLQERAVNVSSRRHTEAKMTFWVKGNPKAGVLSLSCIFSRVIIVTTGSGIGPSLSSLLDRPAAQVARLIWSTRSPRLTYGEAICREVERVDPDAVVIDTDHTGRPDLVQVAWNVYKEIGAEAVFVLSNETVTRKVVYGLESRGVPAFGPIWDS